MSIFSGRRRRFDLPLDLRGTDFQKRCWQELLKIPYGETRSYAEIARAIGNPAAVRAVGLANGQNPIAIIVPCHRVIGSDGSLTGYGGGLETKRKLLELEGALSGSLAVASAYNSLFIRCQLPSWGILTSTSHPTPDPTSAECRLARGFQVLRGHYG